MAGGWGPVLETGLKVSSYTYGPLLGLFMLGFFSRLRGQREVLLGAAAGLIGIALVLAWGRLAWTWNVATGCTITVAFALLFGRLFSRGPVTTAGADET